MELSEADVERLEGLGLRREEFSVEGPDSILRLRNVDGHCCFLVKAEARCRVYQHRPRGCAIYPVNITDDGEIVVDEACRTGGTVTRAEMARKGSELRSLIATIDAEAAARGERDA